MNAVSTRYLAWEACYNARDLGGYPAQQGVKTKPGALVRADCLARLAPAGWVALSSYGIRTIIDLRSLEEVATQPYSLENIQPDPPTFLHLPLMNLEDPERMRVIRTARSAAENYSLVTAECGDNMAAVLKAIANAPPGGVVFHCFAGKDRTGIIAAMLLALAGVPLGIIAQDYAETDRYLQPLYAQILTEQAGNPVEREQLARKLLALPETILGMFAYLERRYGGVIGYLGSIGVSDQEMGALRECLVSS